VDKLALFFQALVFKGGKGADKNQCSVAGAAYFPVWLQTPSCADK
jgi:hypothetical protein